MRLHLYRRHRRDCKSGHPEESRSSELEERHKSWRRCECPIFATGTFVKGRRQRKSTAEWQWEPAKAIAARWEAAGSWDQTTTPSAGIKPAQAAVPRMSITDATEAYLARCQNRGLTDSSLSKYRTSIKQLRAYCDSRGYVILDQLTIADMDRFYASWKDGKRAGAKKLERLKSFVKFCLKRKWLADDITEDLLPQEGSSIPANKAPFTDDELDRIYKACDQLGGPKPPGPGHRDWGGEDLKDFVYLSIYTGLRISDVATFDATKRLNGNNVFLRMHKTKKPLHSYIPDFAVTADSALDVEMSARRVFRQSGRIGGDNEPETSRYRERSPDFGTCGQRIPISPMRRAAVARPHTRGPIDSTQTLACA
jgi:site-specific recombinase XerD